MEWWSSARNEPNAIGVRLVFPATWSTAAPVGESRGIGGCAQADYVGSLGEGPPDPILLDWLN